MNNVNEISSTADKLESLGELDKAMPAEPDVAPWLEPRGIILDVELRNRRHALETAAAAMARMHNLKEEPIFRALWRRELVGSTGLGGGVAIPHARIAGIDRPVILFMRPTYAIDFEAPDGKLVTSILVILVPSDGDPEHHLQLLALISQKFSDAAFRARLAEAGSSDEIWKAFANWLRQMTKWVDD